MLTQDKVQNYGRRLEHTLLKLVDLFPSAKTILWRTSHLPKEIYVVPFERVAAMDAMADYVIGKYTNPQRKTWSQMLSSAGPASTFTSSQLALASKLRIDRTGHLMRGMQ